MSLKHALLGFLNYSPMTGYDLKQSFDRSVQHFWNANLSQIYPTLAKMERDGLVTVEIEYQEGRPNRKIYSITERGSDELAGWLREPVVLPQNRMAFLIKVFFAGSVEKEDIMAQLQRLLTMHRERLSRFRGPVRERLEEGIKKRGSRKDGIFWRLTLEASVVNEEAWIKWCEDAIKFIENLSGIFP